MTTPPASGSAPREDGPLTLVQKMELLRDFCWAQVFLHPEKAAGWREKEMWCDEAVAALRAAAPVPATERQRSASVLTPDCFIERDPDDSSEIVSIYGTQRVRIHVDHKLRGFLTDEADDDAHLILVPEALRWIAEQVREYDEVTRAAPPRDAGLRPVHWRRWGVINERTGNLRAHLCMTEGEATDYRAGDEDIIELAIYPVDASVRVVPSSTAGTETGEGGA